MGVEIPVRERAILRAKMRPAQDMSDRQYTQSGSAHQGSERVLCGCHCGVLNSGAHWHHLANTIEPSVCGGDAALCQITLSICCTARNN